MATVSEGALTSPNLSWQPSTKGFASIGGEPTPNTHTHTHTPLDSSIRLALSREMEGELSGEGFL